MINKVTSTSINNTQYQTSEKTVHLKDILELKEKINAIKKIDNKNHDNIKPLIQSLTQIISENKRKIETSSYKHNPSKIKNLTKMENYIDKKNKKIYLLSLKKEFEKLLLDEDHLGNGNIMINFDDDIIHYIRFIICNISATVEIIKYEIDFLLMARSSLRYRNNDRLTNFNDLENLKNKLYSQLTDFKLYSHEKAIDYPDLNRNYINELINTIINQISSIEPSIKKNNSNLEIVAKDFHITEHLCNEDLSYKDLTQCNFFTSHSSHKASHKASQHINFSGSKLDNLDFGATSLEGSNFTNASMTGTKLRINLANFSNANLQNAKIEFLLPAQSMLSEETLDLLLNDYNNNDNTLFHTINTISDEYPEVKLTLMKQIITLLDKNIIDTSPDILPRISLLNNLVSKPYYLEDKECLQFAQTLVMQEMEKECENISLNGFNADVLSFMISHIDVIVPTSDSQDLRLYINEFFTQLMALSVYNDDPHLQNKARAMYNDYLNLPEIRPFTEMDDFGKDSDGVKEPDWDDHTTPNFILQNNNKTMIIDYDNLSKMLNLDKKDREISWTNFYLYENGECQSPNSINYETLFKHDFPLFSTRYIFDNNRSAFNKLLSTINLNEYKPLFKSVLSGKNVTYQDKLISNEHQIKLYNIFKEILTRPNDNAKETTITAAHYEKILNAFNIKTKTNTAKAQTLFSLAAVFTKYSSSHIFGTEYDSPQTLRNYAYALLNKATELDPTVVGSKYQDWKNALLGLNGQFTCTAMLSNQMMEHGSKHFNETLSKIVPPLWR